MSSEKKEYSAVGASAPTAPTAYIGVPGAPGHQVTMSTPYPAYPASAYTSPAYLPSSAPTYLPATYSYYPASAYNVTNSPYPTKVPSGFSVNDKDTIYHRNLASYAAPLQHHLPYGTVSVAPNITAFGVPPTYLPQLTQVYSPRPGAVYVPAAATYDASARFDGHAVPVVPPPPPGVTPNAAQLAMMQGNPVVLSQQKNSFLSGGSGAGFTFW